MNREEIEKQRTEIIRKYGEWWDNFELVEGVWTQRHTNQPNPRLKRVLQIVHDLSIKPISECRILDLGCANGQFAIEFALHGADVIGIEGREANIQKAIFAKQVMDLDNMKLIQEDVQMITTARFGRFDIILCSGILYHLPAKDVCDFNEKLHEMTDHMLIIDTHVALTSDTTVHHKGKIYHGTYFREHFTLDNDEVKKSRLRASLDNNVSFWFSRPSLMNLLSNVGFSSIYECFNPPIKGIEDRCTFVAIKGNRTALKTSPESNSWTEAWDEGQLSYASKESKIKKRLKWRISEVLDRTGLIKPALSLRSRLKKSSTQL